MAEDIYDTDTSNKIDRGKEIRQLYQGAWVSYIHFTFTGYMAL